MANEEGPRRPNVPGRFWVDQDGCLAHELCVYLAPQNFRYGEGGAYVFKQPETPEEVAQCRDALEACPMAAIFEDGGGGPDEDADPVPDCPSRSLLTVAG